MTLPPNSHLPKPPPKAPPPKPHRADGTPPAPVASPAQAHLAPHGAPPAHPPTRMAPPPSAPRTAAPAMAATPPRPRAASVPASPPGAPARAASALPVKQAADRMASEHRPAISVGMSGLPANLAPMIEAVTLYDSLLAEENALLRAGDSKGVAALLERKIAATHLYQERLRTVLGDPGCTRTLTPDQRQKVVLLVKGMEDRAKENTLLLKANMNAIEKVIEAVNTAARKMRRREVAYSGSGRIRETYSPMGVSMALNRTI